MVSERRPSCPSLQQQHAADFLASWIESNFQMKQTDSSLNFKPIKSKRHVTFSSNITIIIPNTDANHKIHEPQIKRMSPPVAGPVSPPTHQREPMRHPSCNLGETGELQDMIEDDEKALERNVAALRVHDFAFVRRSGGKWTYAILANKPDEDRVRFVVNKKGCTKTLWRHQWSTHVRCVKVPLPQHDSMASTDSSGHAQKHQGRSSIATNETFSILRSSSYTRRKSTGSCVIQSRSRSRTKKRKISHPSSPELNDNESVLTHYLSPEARCILILSFLAKKALDNCTYWGPSF